MLNNAWFLFCQVIQQETNTIRSKLELHFNTSVNIVDACANAIAIIGFVLRFFEVTWETARVLYCINFVIFSLRLFRMYFVSGYLGPKIIMIKRMVSYFYRGYYTVARRYEFYFRVAKQYFTNERSK